MSDLYETDILLWSEQQAEALRRLRHGERRSAHISGEAVVEGGPAVAQAAGPV